MFGSALASLQPEGGNWAISSPPKLLGTITICNHPLSRNYQLVASLSDTYTLCCNHFRNNALKYMPGAVGSSGFGYSTCSICFKKCEAEVSWSRLSRYNNILNFCVWINSILKFWFLPCKFFHSFYNGRFEDALLHLRAHGCSGLYLQYIDLMRPHFQTFYD